MPKRICTQLCFALLLSCVLQSQAAPAPFYLWQSQVTGKLICKQVSPGEGWRLFSGPFLDGGCKKPQPPQHAVSHLAGNSL